MDICSNVYADKRFRDRDTLNFRRYQKKRRIIENKGHKGVPIDCVMLDSTTRFYCESSPRFSHELFSSCIVLCTDDGWRLLKSSKHIFADATFSLCSNVSDTRQVYIISIKIDDETDSTRGMVVPLCYVYMPSKKKAEYRKVWQGIISITGPLNNLQFVSSDFEIGSDHNSLNKFLFTYSYISLTKALLMQ
jgi:hypothetical protein